MLCILDIMVVGIYVKFDLEFKCNAWKRFSVKDYLKKTLKVMKSSHLFSQPQAMSRVGPAGSNVCIMLNQMCHFL